MFYSRIVAKHHKKTPTRLLAGLGILSLSVALFLVIRQWGQSSGWRTSNAITEMHVTNVTPQTADIVWIARDDAPSAQWLEWGEQSYTHTTSAVKKGGVYLASLTSLQANTKYTYRIRAGSFTLSLGKQAVFSFQTPKQTTSAPVTPAYGKIYTVAAKPFADGPLLYTIDGSYPLFTFTKETGEWLIPLGTIVSTKQNSIIPIRDDQLVSITLMGKEGVLARGSVRETRPLRSPLTAGKYVHLVANATDESMVLGATTATQGTRSVPQIIYPKDHALIPGAAPLIRGVGIAGRYVSVTIQGPKLQYGYRALVDDQGDWLVQYPLALAPGDYTISASTQDATGAPFTMQHSFTIIKSGEQVLGVATGSPTLAPSPLPTPTVALSTTPSVTPLPTYPISPTIAYVPSITPTPAALLTTGGGMYGYALAAFICIVAGGIFVLL